LALKSDYVQEERSWVAPRNVIGAEKVLRSGEEREAANTDRDGIYIYKSLILPEVRTGYFQNPYGCVYLLKLLSTTKQLNCKS